jgi:hypothetical protein
MADSEFLERLKTIREAIDFQWRVAKACGATSVAVPVDDADTIYSVLTYVIDTAEENMKQREKQNERHI